MPMSDALIVFQWWGTLFLIGAAVYPITRYIFGSWFDRGFLFTKAMGMALVTLLVYIFGILHIAPFTSTTIWVVMGILFVAGIPLQFRDREPHTKRRALMLALEEVLFFGALLFWTWVKAHEPSIHGLEKYMDFGFTKSILESRYFPAPDMWYAGHAINYYYFGHTALAMLTRLSGIDLTYTFNLMLSTIFALCLTMSFGIGVQLLRIKKGISVLGQIGGGLLTAFLTTLAGNMQTIYVFTKGYTGDAVRPFWELLWPIRDLWQRIPEGMNIYWYANATRFIPYTIHEFPSYSFVVSDVHGHVLSIPFVLLALALLIAMFSAGKLPKNTHSPLFIFQLLMYGALCGVLLMTNALDGPIYFGLLTILLVAFNLHHSLFDWKTFAYETGLVLTSAILTSLPFLTHFKSFVNGLAVNCPPRALTDTRIGPIVFEGVEKCQHSPLWMWWLLWGFFVYCGMWLIIKVVRSQWTEFKHLSKFKFSRIPTPETLLTLFFLFSLVLLIFPEFFYFKDIYPMHFRSNTMFKLGYQAFIMLSIVSGYTIVTIMNSFSLGHIGKFAVKKIFYILLIPQLLLVSMFPIFSVRSYFDSLRQYDGIFGMKWFERQYPDDWAAIRWLNANASRVTAPVIVEADGDSYTDYDRFSAFTGLPTIIGWPVHEWLWRGSYDVVSPRREEVRKIYESQDMAITKQILTSYKVNYVIIGTLERQKYTALYEAKFREIGQPVFTSGITVIYEIH